MAALRTLAGLVIGLAVVVGPLTAQVNERQMFVSVLDENGSPVPDLQVSDFLVREDGALREVVRVARATAPIQLAILVDTSQAAIPAIPHIRNGLHAFVEAMHEGNDLSLITFGGPPRILVDVTRDRPVLQPFPKNPEAEVADIGPPVFVACYPLGEPDAWMLSLPWK